MGRLPSELKAQLTNAELVELIAFHNLQQKARQNPQQHKPRMTNEEAEHWLKSLGAKQV